MGGKGWGWGATSKNVGRMWKTLGEHWNKIENIEDLEKHSGKVKNKQP